MPEHTPRPLIGVTGPDHGGLVAWWFTALAVLRAGGKPHRIRPKEPLPVELLDGLILGGGTDLDPSLYGGDDLPDPQEIKEGTAQARHPFQARLMLLAVYLLRRLFSLKHSVSKDVARDRLEVAMVKDALKQQKPVLGICRGAQMLNAALGGSLHRETREFYTETPYIRSVLPKKKIRVMPGTLLASLWPLDSYRVNALHHQAVSQVADGWKVAAVEDNGLIQAVENPSLPLPWAFNGILNFYLISGINRFSSKSWFKPPGLPDVLHDFYSLFAKRTDAAQAHGGANRSSPRV